MGLLAGWDHYVDLEVDAGVLDEDLTHPPIRVRISTSCGKGDKDASFVFDEVGSNSLRIALTKPDGTTEIYAEIERWDAVSEVAELFCSKSDLTLDFDASPHEKLRLYFDNAHADNTTYVGDVGSVPGQAVWDANYKAVWHLRESGDHVGNDYKDSTSNGNDMQGGGGTSTKVPSQADGQIGKCQEFDGADDYLLVPSSDGVGHSLDLTGDMTFEAWANLASGVSEDYYTIIAKRSGSNYQYHFRVRLVGGTYYLSLLLSGGSVEATAAFGLGAWHYAGMVRASGTNIYAYLDSAKTDTLTDQTCAHKDVSATVGEQADGATHPWEDYLDEARISDTDRSDAWMKFNYYSGDDNLLTWGDVVHLKSLSGLVDVTGIVGRATGKTLAGSVGVVGTVERSITYLKSVIGNAVVSGSVSRTMKYYKALAVGLVSATGTVGRSIKKELSGSVATTGVVGRSIGKALVTGIAVATGVITRKTLKTLSGGAAVTGTVIWKIPKMIVSYAIVTGTVNKHIGKTVAASAAVAGTVERHIRKGLATAQAVVTGAIEKTLAEVVLGGVIVTGTIGKLVKKTLSGAVAVTGAVARQLYDINYTMNMTVRRIFGKVRITYTDPYFSAGVEASATETGRLTYPEQTTDNVEDTAFKWFSLHRNALDGTFHPMPSMQEHSVGWWSATLCDAVTAEFDPDPVLTLTTAARTVESLLVVGDDKLNEYPVDFWVRLYSAGDVLEYEWHETGNTGVVWEKDLTPVETDIVKLTLTVEKWSRVSSVAKIAQFFTTLEETYEGDDLVSIRVLEEREYQEPTIPQGNVSASEIVVRLNNIDDIFSAGNFESRLYGLLLNNRAIKAWLGVDIYPSGYRRWYPLGVFYSRDWIAPEGEVWAEVRGLDALDRLQRTEFSTSTVYEDKSLSWLAQLVMTDAGLTAADWEIDTALKSIIIPYAWFDRMSHREALRRIAAACLGQVYCDRDGKIVVEVYQAPATASFEFTEDNVFDIDHPLPWSQVVNHVQARAWPRVPAANQAICTDTETFSIGAGATVTKTHYFDLSPCVDVLVPVLTDADPDIVVDSWTAYAWGGVAAYKNNGGTPEDVRQVDISGKPLETQGSRIVVAEDPTSIAQNGKQSLSEPITSEFWQTEAQAQVSADSLLASYKDPRRDVMMRARGNIALLLGDRVAAPDYRGAVVGQYGVMRQDINWDGGLVVAVDAQKISGAPTLFRKELGGEVAVTGSVPERITHYKEPGVGGVVVTGSVGRKVLKPVLGLVGATGAIQAIPSIWRKTCAGNAIVVGTVGRVWPIDLGAAAIDRAQHFGDDYTLILLDNPACNPGTLGTVKIWAEDPGPSPAGWKVGTFYGSGTDYTSRDHATLPTVSAGYNEFTGLSIDVLAGDYIGLFVPSGGYVDAHSGGGAGVYGKTGDQFGAGVQTYSPWGAYIASVYGEGQGTN